MTKKEIAALVVLGFEMAGMHILGKAFRKEARRRARACGFADEKDLLENGTFDENGKLVRIKGR